MSEESYRIVFCGKIKEGERIEDVVPRLAKLFKKPEDAIRKTLNGRCIRIKKGMDYQDAQAAMARLDQIGAVFALETEDGSVADQTSGQPAVPACVAESPQSSHEPLRPEPKPPTLVTRAAPQPKPAKDTAAVATTGGGGALLVQVIARKIPQGGAQDASEHASPESAKTAESEQGQELVGQLEAIFKDLPGQAALSSAEGCIAGISAVVALIALGVTWYFTAWYLGVLLGLFCLVIPQVFVDPILRPRWTPLIEEFFHSDMPAAFTTNPSNFAEAFVKWLDMPRKGMWNPKERLNTAWSTKWSEEPGWTQIAQEIRQIEIRRRAEKVKAQRDLEQRVAEALAQTYEQRLEQSSDQVQPTDDSTELTFERRVSFGHDGEELGDGVVRLRTLDDTLVVFRGMGREEIQGFPERDRETVAETVAELLEEARTQECFRSYFAEENAWDDVRLWLKLKPKLMAEVGLKDTLCGYMGRFVHSFALNIPVFTIAAKLSPDSLDLSVSGGHAFRVFSGPTQSETVKIPYHCVKSVEIGSAGQEVSVAAMVNLLSGAGDEKRVTIKTHVPFLVKIGESAIDVTGWYEFYGISFQVNEDAWKQHRHDWSGLAIRCISSAPVCPACNKGGLEVTGLSTGAMLRVATPSARAKCFLCGGQFLFDYAQGGFRPA